METVEVLEHLPALIDGLEQSRPVSADVEPEGAPFTLVAEEPGQGGRGVVRLGSYAQARSVALELNERGFGISITDSSNNERLRMLPRPSHA